MLNRLTEKALFVEQGYGQVEPNHLSAQRNGQIYAQLPTNSDIKVLENGQFVKYDYRNNEVNFTGAGEWMLVLNEIKLYRDHQKDCEFAMVKGNYLHEVYSPYGEAEKDYQSRFYGPKDANGNDNGGRITTAADSYELDSTDNPFAMLTGYKAQKMADRNAMVPRVLKTMVGDIFTTNTIADETVALGAELSPNAEGYLSVNGDGSMKWQVVKVYTMPDGQKGVKIMRIA
jgi:hypothetical protein